MNNANTVNGFPVIAEYTFPAYRGTRGGRVLIAHRVGHPVHQYAVAAQFLVNQQGEPQYESSWYQGYYHDSPLQAWNTFKELVEDYAMFPQHEHAV